MSDLPAAGHNLPPSMAVTAAETMKDISAWLAEHPVIDSDAYAREAKVYIDRGKLCLKDLEDERDGKVRPLNEQVAEINEHYRGPRELLRKVLENVQHRFSAYLRAEQAKREAAAEAARLAAREAERIARDVELLEKQRVDDAKAGELGVNIAEAVEQADKAFSAYQKAERKAAIAEKEINVRVGGGFGRAIGLRNKETLSITNYVDAVGAIGITEGIKEAILSGARAYRKLHNKLPPGITSEIEREV